MSRLPQGEGRTWWLAGGIAAMGLGLLVLLVSLRRTAVAPAPVSLPPAASGKIGLTRLVQQGGDNLVADEARFFDPTPLFLPTEWNADQKTLPANILRDPGQMFQDFPSKIFFRTDDLVLSFPSSVMVPERPADALTVIDDEMPYLGIGQGDGEVVTLPGRGGYVEVVALATGRRILAESLSAAAPPTANWRPFELLAVVNAAGLVGRLSLVERSGVEEVDTYFQNYLVKTLNLGDRLRPGFYRICVGP